jgi:hypothetical protein
VDHLRADEWHRRQSEEVQKEREKELKARTLQFSKNSQEKREVVITLKTGDKIKGSRFSEIIRHPNTPNCQVDHCNITIICGEFDVSIAFSKHIIESLNINITPPGKQESAELFVKLEQWARNIALPKWIVFWKKYNGLQWGLVIALLGGLFSLALVPVGGSKEEIRKEAVSLLKKGIGPNDQEKAFTLILSFLADYPGGPPMMHIRPWFWFAAGTTLLMSILIAFPPRSAIGIGCGARSIAHWRTWIKIVSITLPTFLIMNVLSSTVGSAVFEWIRGHFH